MPQVLSRETAFLQNASGRLKILNENILECVPLKISYDLCFLRISKVSRMLHHGLVGRGLSKWMLLYIYIHFLRIIKKRTVFFKFSFLFLMKYQIPAKEYNQSETGIGDQKLSVELWVC